MEKVANQVLMGNLDLKDLRVHRDNPVQVDLEVNLVCEATLDPQDSLALL